jgi:hypothetical protein
MVEAADEQYLKRAAAMAARLWIEPDSRHRAMSLCASFGPDGQSAGQRFIANFGNILPGTDPDGA